MANKLSFNAPNGIWVFGQKFSSRAPQVRFSFHARQASPTRRCGKPASLGRCICPMIQQSLGCRSRHILSRKSQGRDCFWRACHCESREQRRPTKITYQQYFKLQLIGILPGGKQENASHRSHPAGRHRRQLGSCLAPTAASRLGEQCSELSACTRGSRNSNRFWHGSDDFPGWATSRSSALSWRSGWGCRRRWTVAFLSGWCTLDKSSL